MEGRASSKWETMASIYFAPQGECFRLDPRAFVKDLTFDGRIITAEIILPGMNGRKIEVFEGEQLVIEGNQGLLTELKADVSDLRVAYSGAGERVLAGARKLENRMPSWLEYMQAYRPLQLAAAAIGAILAFVAVLTGFIRRSN
jgi:hypothetical protein